MAAIGEIKTFLSYKKLEDHVHQLLDNGYDDLDAISQLTHSELMELEALFKKEDDKQAIHRLVISLQRVGIVAYRNKRNKTGQDMFKKLLESDLNTVLSPLPASFFATATSTSGSGAGEVDEKQEIIDKLKKDALEHSDKHKKEVEEKDKDKDKGEIKRQKSAQKEDSDDSDDEGKKKEMTWEEIVEETAKLRALYIYHGICPVDKKLPGPPAPRIALTNEGHPIHTNRVRSVQPLDKQLRQLISMLINGEKFQKYKHGKGKSRDIWCTPYLDHVVWGEHENENIKGFLRAADISEVNQGMGKSKSHFFVVTQHRTLELEAKSPEMAEQWVKAFDFLILSQTNERKKRSELDKITGLLSAIDSYKDIHYQLLKTGDVFKKWPGRKKIQKGSFQLRKIWADDKLTAIHWGELNSNKSKGDVKLETAVSVEEDDSDKEQLKFSLITEGRSLDLEAKSPGTRDQWVRALRYCIHQHKLQGTSAKEDDD